MDDSEVSKNNLKGTFTDSEQQGPYTIRTPTKGTPKNYRYSPFCCQWIDWGSGRDISNPHGSFQAHMLNPSGFLCGVHMMRDVLFRVYIRGS